MIVMVPSISSVKTNLAPSQQILCVAPPPSLCSLYSDIGEEAVTPELLNSITVPEATTRPLIVLLVAVSF